MYTVEIFTPEKRVFQGEALHLTAPGKGGSFGVLTSHAPILASLNPGDIKIDLTDNTRKIFTIPGGFLEMDNNRLIILADSIQVKQEQPAGHP